MSDRQKVLAWLASIGEEDEKCILQVIEQCKSDPEARKYYVEKYNSLLVDN